MILIFIIILLIPIAYGFYQESKKNRDKIKAEKIRQQWINRYRTGNTTALSPQQLEDIKNDKQLPCLPPDSIPIILRPGEIAVYHAAADLVKSKYITGQFIITTKRTVFISETTGFDLQNSKILSFSSEFDTNLTIQSGRSVYKLELQNSYIVEKVFNAVIYNTIPLESEKVLSIKKSSYQNYIESDSPYEEGHRFEYYCAELLRKNGFSEVKVTQASGDQGVDILAKKDGVRYAIQCKHFQSSLGNKPIQEVNAGKTFYKCHVGVVMTNSTFTPGAKELAEATGVLLWDREKIKQMEKATK